MIGYSVSNLPFIFHVKENKKYEDLIAYKDAKNIKRADNKLAPLGYFLAALLFLIIALILYLVYKLN